MQNVILAIHIIACVTLIGVILLQRSEGGALGMGGGGGGGGLMSGRSAAGALVRTTMIAAAIFFTTTLTLTTMANRGRVDTSVIGADGSGEIPLDIRDVTNDPNAPLFNETPADDAITDTSPILEDPVDETHDEEIIEPFVEQAPVGNDEE